MKRTKWAGYQFSLKQREARRKVREAHRRFGELYGGLRMCPYERDRVRLHARLDTVLDGIERLEREAKELFPEVEESFTVATMMIEL